LALLAARKVQEQIQYLMGKLQSVAVEAVLLTLLTLTVYPPLVMDSLVDQEVDHLPLIGRLIVVALEPQVKVITELVIVVLHTIAHLAAVVEGQQVLTLTEFQTMVVLVQLRPLLGLL
jgi:hypothetical protein